MSLVIRNNILKYYRKVDGEKTLVIPEGVTEIAGNAFTDGKELTEIVIPESVTKIEGWTFCGCAALENIRLPESVNEIGESAFRECTSLTHITLPERITKISENTFDGCTALKELTIPQRVTEIGAYAFWDCSSMTELTIPEHVAELPEDIFAKCESLRVIKLHPDDPAIPRSYGTQRKLETAVNAALQMLRNGTYSSDITDTIPPAVRYPFLVMYYLRTKDEALRRYITGHFDKIMQESISSGSTELIQALNRTNEFLSAENIDPFILQAQTEKQYRTAAFLMDYKNRHFGFAEDTGLL